MLKTPSGLGAPVQRPRRLTTDKANETEERLGLENYHKPKDSPKKAELMKSMAQGTLSKDDAQGLLAGMPPDVNISKPEAEASVGNEKHLKLSELSDLLIRAAMGNRGRQGSPTRELSVSQSSTPIPSRRTLETKKSQKGINQLV